MKNPGWTMNAAVVLAVILSATAPSAWAAAVEEGALAVLRPGHHLRIETDTEETVRGRFVTVENGELVLEKPARRVPLQALREVRVRGRATGRGARIGAGTMGLVTGGIFALGVAAMCEAGNCDGASLAGGAVGLAFGVLLGGPTGGLIGAAVPEWRDVRRTRSAPTRDKIGWSSFDAGFGKGLDSLAPRGGFGGTLALTADLGTVSPGLELGRQFLGRRQVQSARGDRVDYEESLTFFAPTVTLTPSRGRLSPYVVASAGLYYWQALDPQIQNALSGVEDAVSTRSFWGGSLGAGVRLRSRGPLSLGMEGRWHTNLAAVPRVAAGERERRLSQLSLKAGATVSW